jgi:hypothetical protein
MTLRPVRPGGRDGPRPATVPNRRVEGWQLLFTGGDGQ